MRDSERGKPDAARPGLLALGAVAAYGLILAPAGSCLRVERPYPAPTAKQVLAALRARDKAVRTLRAEARMHYRTDQGKVKATVRMMARRPDDLRFDLVSPMDTRLATLVESDGQFALVDARNNRHYYGPATPCNLARLLRVQLRPEDIVAVLSGGTPLIRHHAVSLSWDDRAGAEVLTIKGSNLSQVVRLDGRDRRWRLLSSEMRDRQGRLVLALRANNHHEVDGVELPRRILVRQPAADAQMQLDFSHQEINIDLPGAAFERPQADGLPSKRVDCTTANPRAGRRPAPKDARQPPKPRDQR